MEHSIQLLQLQCINDAKSREIANLRAQLTQVFATHTHTHTHVHTHTHTHTHARTCTCTHTHTHTPMHTHLYRRCSLGQLCQAAGNEKSTLHDQHTHVNLLGLRRGRYLRLLRRLIG